MALFTVKISASRRLIAYYTPAIADSQSHKRLKLPALEP